MNIINLDNPGYESLQKLERRAKEKLNDLLKKGRADFDSNYHLGTLRGGHAALYFERHLKRILESKEGITLDGTPDAFIELDENAQHKLIEFIKNTKNQKIEKKEDSAPKEQIKKVRPRFSEKSFIQPPKIKSYDGPKWGRETPELIGVNNLEPLFIYGYDILNERDKEIGKITNDINIFSLDDLDYDETVLLLDPRITQKEIYINRKMNDIKTRINKLDEELKTKSKILEELNEKIPTDEELDDLSEKEYKKHLPKINKYNHKLRVYNKSSKRMERLEKQFSDLQNTNPSENAEEMFNQLEEIRNGIVEVPVFMFPENGARSQLITPMGNGLVSKYISKELSHLLKDLSNYKTTKISEVYEFPYGNDYTDIIQEPLRNISNKTKKHAGLSIYPKFIDDDSRIL